MVRVVTGLNRARLRSASLVTTIARRAVAAGIAALLLARRTARRRGYRAGHVLTLLDLNEYSLEPHVLAPGSSDSQPVLSIVIPVYNAGSRLRRCLDSIAQQVSTHDFEVLCIDDGSTDGSRALVEEFVACSTRFTLVYQANAGIAAARNRGIALARGTYVLLVDNDDALTSDFVQTTLDLALSTGVAIVKTGHVEVDELSGRRTSVVADIDSGIRRHLGAELHELDGYAWGTLFSRDLFRHISFPRGAWYEDMITRLLLYRLADELSYVPRPLYLKYEHAENAARSVWSEHSEKALDQVALVRSIRHHDSQLGLRYDSWARGLYLAELGPFLYLRTRRSPEPVRRKAFELAAAQFHELPLADADAELSYIGTAFEQSLGAGDYKSWKLAGLHVLLSGSAKVMKT
jgi:glycosyltransferase involved in cell wall biosynthesis